ncbi:hypothetical protein [Actinoplanes utahensis]|uniref:Uncharacterized protein n=1 Tax=Actinoplanes utahensis TaxID=1869 RepID=A0A0A6X6M3_ACTUT|nr:hypothetical protein [Actinoplanes utahensis]KHD75752.1 hypothetical protein MB27_21300 [Actinoplanes utahensis]GIF34490.1 hypothetical protein Aut01nite_74760 [Actinoplanes utahensis]
MEYSGSIVVARAHRPLSMQDGVEGVGPQHRYLRELGDGWQMLESVSLTPSPDLAGVSAAVAASTGWPVLSFDVIDGDCAAMCAATPGRTGALTHLWDVREPCPSYHHQPAGEPPPRLREPDEVVAELVAWAATAGLRPDPERLLEIISLPGGGADRDRLFALVTAVGAERVGPTRPWSVPLGAWPFSQVVYGPVSLSAVARSYARHRVADPAGWATEPEASWEAPAIALEAEVWASLFRDGVDVIALARRAFAVHQDYVVHTFPGKDLTMYQEWLDEFEATIAAGGARAAMMFDPEY